MEIKKENNIYNFLIHSILVMNIFDLILTYIGLRNNYIIEGNIMLAYMYDIHHLLFVFVKLAAIVFFGFALLKLMKKITITRIIKILLWMAFMLYTYISILHIMILFFK